MNGADGFIEIRDSETGSIIAEADTHQCVHCGGHFTMKPKHLITKTLTAFEAKVLESEGKKTRGFCQRCNGYICGPSCAKCVPIEQLLENYEQHRNELFRPIVVGWTP